MSCRNILPIFAFSDPLLVDSDEIMPFRLGYVSDSELSDGSESTEHFDGYLPCRFRGGRRKVVRQKVRTAVRAGRRPSDLPETFVPESDLPDTFVPETELPEVEAAVSEEAGLVHGEEEAKEIKESPPYPHQAILDFFISVYFP